MRKTGRTPTLIAIHRRTAERYWRLADAAEKKGLIARAREFVSLALTFDQRAADAAHEISSQNWGPSSGAVR